MRKEASTENLTYRELYNEGNSALSMALEEEREAQLDARLLLEHVCGTGLQTLLLDGEGYDFFPVPEEEVMREVCDGDRILDLCTGSGCILLSLLNYSNGSTGVGTDLSEGAIAVAKENALKLGLSERCDWKAGDLFEAVDPGEKFDIIVSNPPYIRSETIGELAPEVRIHEPRMALDGGDDGLYFYKRIIPEAADYLRTGGMLFLEIGYDQAEQVGALMKDAGYYEVRTIKDYGGNDRIVCGIKSIHQE